MKKRIVITGMGVITPVGNNVNDTWSALLEGKNGIGPITYFDVSKYETRIAGEIKNFDPNEVMEKKEVRRTPKFIQYGLKAAKEALEQSGLVGICRARQRQGGGASGFRHRRDKCHRRTDDGVLRKKGRAGYRLSL